MAALTICSDFRAQGEESVTDFTFSPSACHEVMGLGAMISVLILSFKPDFSLSGSSDSDNTVMLIY